MNTEILNSINYEEICGILRSLNDKKPLEDRYTVKVPELPEPYNKAFEDIIEKEKCGDNPFKINCLLKEHFKDFFDSDNPDAPENKVLANWIINVWGGLSDILDETANRSKTIIDYLELGFKGEIPDISMKQKDYISPASKVLSFINPEVFAICDSRVLFSLNWLLLFTAKETPLIQFQALPMRNRICNSYNIQYVLEKNSSLTSGETTLTTYGDVLAVMKNLAEKLGWKLYETEMFLFSISEDLDSGIPYVIREKVLQKCTVEDFRL